MRNLFFVFFFLISIPLMAEEKIQFFYNIPPKDHPDQRGVRAKLIEEINSAAESLEGAFYQVNDPQVIDAFLRAVRRGVRVEIVTDTDWVQHKDYIEDYQRLKKGGVTVVDDQRLGLSHNKYCIIDRKSYRARVWMGSTNITTQCNIRNGNASFLLIGSRAAQIFYLDFKQMIEGKFQKNKGGIFQTGDQLIVVQDKLKTPAGLDPKDFLGMECPVSYPTLSMDGTSIEIFFSPRHNIERKIIEALYSAKESIHFATYTLDNPMIYQTMMNKAKMPKDKSPYNLYPVAYRQDPWEESHRFFHAPGEEGGAVKKVSVYGIINRLGSNDGPYRTFLKYGIPVRMSAFPGALHHKFIMIDKEVLILGSYNFSASAESENDESAMIIRDKKIVSEFYEKVFVPTYQHSYPEYLPREEELKEFALPRYEIAISEIHFLPKKGASEAKYVELHNYAACSSESECEEKAIDLRGWKLWNGLIPWHDDPKIRGTTDDLVSYYHDPYKNRHAMNYERGGYFLKPELEILRPGEYALVVGRDFDPSYLNPYLAEYEKQFEKIYGRKPNQSYEKYPKLFVSALPYDKKVGDGLKPFQFVTLFYSDKFTMADRFMHNLSFIKNPGRGDILELLRQMRRPFKWQWQLETGQSLERVNIDRRRLGRSYEPFFEAYENAKYFLYWYGLSQYSDADDWEPNRDGGATPGFAY